MNYMTDGTSYSTPWDIEDDPIYSEEEEFFDEEASDELRHREIYEQYY